jgi:hypothetical protein
VIIFVSGFVIDKEDYKRAFGVLPDDMNLEVLTAIYESYRLKY